jgi:hypothetical protein
VFERVMDSYEFPTDLPDDPDQGAGALRWTASVIALTTALLALLNAQALTGWTQELPPGPGVVKLVDAATAWEDATAQLGLGAGHARMHKTWKAMQRAQWSAQPATVQEARR